ncbi:MAG: crossover junction endodeoxyribonuclease RuvC [Acidimicrobiales bacterium]
MFVLGIDPGVSRCGYGCVRRTGSKLTAEAGGVLTTSPVDPLPERLATLAEDLEVLIDELRPDVVVVERVFFQTNARTAMSVGQASGLALAAAARAGCQVAEYTSNEVKQSVAGYGSAEKYQVQKMVQILLDLPAPPEPPDAADALALALCHLRVAPMLAKAAQAERVLSAGRSRPESSGRPGPAERSKRLHPSRGRS